MIMWRLSIASLVLAVLFPVGSVAGHAAGLLSAPVTVVGTFVGAIFYAGSLCHYLDIQVGRPR